MDELFGAPVSSIALVLGVWFGIIGPFLSYIAIRDNVLVRMALRNVMRRPLRAILIVIGLMLATAIISSSFTTGDSITYSIKRNATDDLRSVDEVIIVDDDSEVWEGVALPDEFSEDIFQQVGPKLEAATDIIDAVMPALLESTSVINLRSKQFEVEALLTGLDPSRAHGFDPLNDIDGNPVDLATLEPDELYIDVEGAQEPGVRVGDTLGVAVRPGELEPLRVKSIIDGWYFKRANTKVVLMVSLSRAQELLGREGQLSAIGISNLGNSVNGVALTSQVLERFGDAPAGPQIALRIAACLKSETLDWRYSI